MEKIKPHVGASHEALNSINENLSKSQKTISLVKDKSDRATVEQVLDPRTRVILVKASSDSDRDIARAILEN